MNDEEWRKELDRRNDLVQSIMIIFIIFLLLILFEDGQKLDDCMKDSISFKDRKQSEPFRNGKSGK